MNGRVLPLLLLVTMGSACKRAVPPPPPEGSGPRVDLRLQITSVTPRSIPPDKASRAKVYGSGFEADATVVIGTQPVAKARVVDPNTIEIDIDPMAAGIYDVVVSNASGASATLTNGLTVGAMSDEECRFTRVFFGFDSAGLDAESISELNRKTECYQTLATRIAIVGHADERGTTDYNLALGQRRAETIRGHLAGQGVSGARIQTVSYGEEQPLERGSNESAWARNRRAEVTAE